MCQFPFVYEGVEYNECTTVNNARPWCYTDQENGKWGNCECSEHRTCSNKRCKPTWEYKGHTFSGCSSGAGILRYDQVHYRSWCKVEGGEGAIVDGWDNCDNCTGCKDWCLKRFQSLWGSERWDYCVKYDEDCGGCNLCVELASQPEWRRELGRRL